MANEKSDQDKPQIEKFREAAKELGCDESEEAFDEALRRVGQHRPKRDSDKPGADERPAPGTDTKDRG